MLPEEINALLQSMSNAQAEGDQEVEGQRTERLRGVLVTSKELWAAGAEEIDGLLEKLATGSRDASWRAPLGASGVLEYFLGLLAQPGLRLSLKIQILRLAGNSCADTDENRARAVEGNHVTSIVRLLDDEQADAMLQFIVPCLYNICVDYEPSQVQASQAGILKAYIALLGSPLRVARIRHVVGIIGKMLALLATQDVEQDSADVKVPAAILEFVKQPLDLEEFCSFTSAALAYLSKPELRESCARSGPGFLFKTLQIACERYASEDADDEDEAGEFKAVRKALVGVVADVTALPDYASRYGLGRNDDVDADGEDDDADEYTSCRHPDVFKYWLGRHHSPLQEAGCLVLGNLACSDASSTSLVHQFHDHEPVVEMLLHHFPYQAGPDDASPSALLHAAVGLLKNLAIPAANKQTLGAWLLDPSSRTGLQTGKETASSPHPTTALVTRLWTCRDAQPQTQLAVVSLTRLLLVGNFSNTALFCAPLPKSEPGKDEDEKPSTTLHALIELFADAETEPTKIEAGRAALALCRLLHSSSSLSDIDDILPASSWGSGAPDDETSRRRARFYEAHAGLADLISLLMTQDRFPALRSEALFVFALMSRSADGAAVVARALTTTPDAVKALAAAVGVADEEQTSSQNESAAKKELSGGIEGLSLDEPRQAVDPKQAAGMARVDRENSLVLLTELLRNHPECVPEEQRGRFESLLNVGSELVMAERTKTE